MTAGPDVQQRGLVVQPPLFGGQCLHPCARMQTALVLLRRTGFDFHQTCCVVAGLDVMTAGPDFHQRGLVVQPSSFGGQLLHPCLHMLAALRAVAADLFGFPSGLLSCCGSGMHPPT
eukprot:CAMPEP_0175276842 /NCGR_PEP_ID=MMETSP0093-20121207/48696_1 /TAXON_ID=311494 /ORGANISM="Alexandrium monilatum, Strain CCMP3105" /LENGTH=116 /DNA_ID=CAMNT_0016571769 /DNA_START=146 /DNA_END=493 /DNA_ORIENTATION=-